MFNMKVKYNEYKLAIAKYEMEHGPADGIVDVNRRHAFILQLCDSARRIDHIGNLRSRVGKFSENSIDPLSSHFNPIKAAIKFNHDGNKSEAIWLLFLFTHFGVHKVTKHKLLQAFYSRISSGPINTFEYIRANLEETLEWLGQNELALKGIGKFGNHRKYQSISATSHSGTGTTLKTFIDFYLRWFSPLLGTASNDLKLLNSQALFSELYKRMINEVIGFNRLSVFDFLTMLGKSQVLMIIPDNPFLQNSTGPKMGARMLFGVNDLVSDRELNIYLSTFASYLPDPFRMQVIEDAVCNWQKSPNNYIYFSG